MREFADEAAFEAWLAAHMTGAGGLDQITSWVGAGVDHAEGGDRRGLCWGWIDAIRKRFDERSYLQRYTPRGRKSVWSAINVGMSPGWKRPGG